MTTNAQMLQGQAAALKQAGLRRINISLDSLDADTFREMTGGELAAVLSGIDEAVAAGLTPVRINAVLVRGKNAKRWIISSPSPKTGRWTCVSSS
jgi:Molybdenum cofactor biosynthesis enzyme